MSILPPPQCCPEVFIKGGVYLSESLCTAEWNFSHLNPKKWLESCAINSTHSKKNKKEKIDETLKTPKRRKFIATTNSQQPQIHSNNKQHQT